MSSSVFTAAAAASKRELVIKKELPVLSPEALAVEHGDYDSLFSVTSLNYLVVCGFPEVTSLNPKIGQLQNLFQLLLTDNALTELPDEISSLTKLKLLDVSRNQLTKVPSSFYSLNTLQTVNMGHNSLTDDSFPSDVPSGCFPNLHHVDLVGNRLTHLPDFVYLATDLLDIVAIDNAITTIEPTIGALSSLKQVDLKRNQISLLPYELTLCSKLKSLDLVDNPISDRRLLKLVTQHGPNKPKAILDYVASHAPKPSSGKKGKGKKGGSHDHVAMATDIDDDVTFVDSRPRLQVVRPAVYAEVLVSPDARRVRPYLVCAIVRDVDLVTGNKFRKFINLQTKLHDGVCKRRRAATIATHDLHKLSLPLSYTCHPATDLEIVPLGQTTPQTVREFISLLETNKTDKRGGKGSGAKESDPAAAALSKYLQFVNRDEMVCLRDNTDTVVSLPPLTNSENTKIETSSTDIFLEVTSTVSLATCKTVMDSLVCGMCEGGVGVSSDGVMKVEQVKVMDLTDRQLLVLYPSRTDLIDCSSISVVRPD